MSELSFRERFQITRIEKLAENDFATLKSENVYLYEKLLPEMFHLLLPLSPVAAACLLDRFPDFTDYLIDIEKIHHACTDDTSFKKITYLMTQMEFKDNNKRQRILRGLIRAAKEVCPDALEEVRGFYQEGIKEVF